MTGMMELNDANVASGSDRAVTGEAGHASTSTGHTRRRLASDALHVAGRPLDASLGDFWAWMGSDLLHNAFRGQLAEYLVAQALGCHTSTRPGWNEYDLLTPDGIRLEVKSSAYVQSWQQDRHSSPRFSIRAACRYGEHGREDTPKRHAAVYVFALLHHRERSSIDPLDLAQWTFYVLPTTTLDRACSGQKMISLGALKTLGAAACGFEDLAAHVRSSAQQEDVFCGP